MSYCSQPGELRGSCTDVGPSRQPKRRLHKGHKVLLWCGSDLGQAVLTGGSPLCSPHMLRASLGKPALQNVLHCFLSLFYPGGICQRAAKDSHWEDQEE